jgi:ATP-dependent DNA helicase PIF1
MQTPAWASEVVRFEHTTRPAQGTHFVGITVGGPSEMCNMNIPNGNYTNDLGMRLKYEDVNTSGVNGQFGNPGAKIGMPVGFRVGQFLTGRKADFVAAVLNETRRLELAGGFPLPFPNRSPVQVILDTLVRGVSDRSTQSDDQKPNGDSRQIRESVREKFLRGESYEYSHGMRIVQIGPNSLEQLLQVPGFIDERTGFPTNRQFFMIIGRVPDMASVNLLTRGTAKQYRLYCDEVTVYHINPDAISRGEVFGDTTTDMFLGGNIFERLGLATTPTVTAEATEPAAAATVDIPTNTIPDTNPTNEVNVTEPITKSEPAGSITQQLEHYYNAVSLRGERGVSTNALTVQETINTFNVVDYDELNALARKRLAISALSSNRASENVANAVRYYIFSHISNGSFQGNSEAINLGDYPWSMQQIKDIFDIMHGVAKLNGITGLAELTAIDGEFIINFGEEVGFSVVDEYVYDQRGRLLMSVLEMIIEERVVDGKRQVRLAGVQYVSSITALVRLLYFGYLPLLTQGYTNTITSLSANFASFVNDEYVTQHLVKFSQDNIKNQNAAAMHRIHSEHGVLVHARCNPFVAGGWMRADIGALAGRFAKAITYHYRKQTKNYNVSEFWPEVISYAMNAYGLDYNFAKKVFVNGFLGHIRMDYVEKYLLQHWAAMQELHGVSTNDIIAASDKPSKGIKRVALAMAMAAKVYGARTAGWQLYTQQHELEGSLQPVALLPTLVLPPGMSLWVGPDEERPIGLVQKTFKSFKVDVPADCRPEFNLGCLLRDEDYTYSTITNVGGTWTQVTPKVATMLERHGDDRGDLTIAEVTVNGVKNFVNHISNYSGKLNWIRWRVSTNMQLQDPINELTIVWSITTAESWPKVRSIAKAMLAGVSRDCIKLAADRPVNIVHAQDGIKADVLYAWLMVCGNTLRYNWDNPAVSAMRAEAVKINTMLGQPDYQGVLIELVSVVAGYYQRLQELFEETFGQVVSVYLPSMGDTGRMMFDMHQCDDYELLDARYGEHAYIRKGEDPSNPRTNITRFRIVDGVVTEVHQRCYGFASIPGCPLYNVELFESSTIMEAVSESCMVPNASRAMTYTGGFGDAAKLRALSMEFHESMTPNLYRLKAMFQMFNAGTFGCANVIYINQAGNNFGFTREQMQFMHERLAPLGLSQYRNNQAKMFETVANAFKDTVFVFNSANGVQFSIYMPALRTFNKLANSGEAVETLSSVFFENTFKPMVVNPGGVAKAVVSSVYGKLKSMVRSGESAKLLKGRVKLTARRVGMCCVPVSETWILYSERQDSLYRKTVQYFKRFGHKLEIGLNTAVYNGRDPMIAGWFSRIRVVTLDDCLEYGWYMGPHTFGVSPVASYIDGGDFDGDPHTVTFAGPEAESEVMTYERVLDIRNRAMGTNMLFSGGYAFDHYTRKSFTKAARTLSVTAVAGAKRKRSEYIKYNVGAHQVQNVAVGQCYKLCMIAENIIQLTKDLAACGKIIPNTLLWACNSNASDIIISTTEIYEVMLGGYSPEAERLYEVAIKSAVQEGRPVSAELNKPGAREAFEQILADYGANVSLCDEYIQALDVVAMTQSIQIYGKLSEELIREPLLAFVVCSALCSFELIRGRFEGFKGAIGNFKQSKPSSEGHFAALNYTYYFMGHALLNYEMYNEYADYIQYSHVLTSLFRVLSVLAEELGLERPDYWPVKNSVTPEFLASFSTNDESDNDDDDDKGGSIVRTTNPTNPTPSNMPAATTPVVETEPVEAEPTAALLELQSNPLFEGLTGDQCVAFNELLQGKNTFISGEAGTGKSYLLQHARQHFIDNNWYVVVTGSTGVSVMNINGDGTFNSKFGLGLGFKRGAATGDQAFRIMSNARASRMFKTTVTPNGRYKGVLFIVDEISMVDTKLLAITAELVQETGLKVQWLLVGDPGQCSPVDGELFFKDYVLRHATTSTHHKSFLTTGEFSCVCLREVVRQADDLPFLHALQSMRQGEALQPTILERYKVSQAGLPEQAIHAFFNNECVRKYNQERTNAMIAAGAAHRVYSAKIKRLKIYNEEAFQRFLKWFDPIEEHMTLCIGMPVMIRSNIKEGSKLIAANGTVGTITHLGEGYVTVTLKNGTDIDICQDDIEGPRNSNNEALGTFKQLCLHPAFALTGHKLQGLTITEPLVVHAYQRRSGNLVPVTCTGWLYVVCSRVTHSDLLYFDTQSSNAFTNLLNSLSTDREALAWINNLSKNQ